MKTLLKGFILAICILIFSSAYANWKCTAFDGHNRSFVGGGHTRFIARTNALQRCHIKSPYPRRCYINNCHPKRPDFHRKQWKCRVGSRGQWVGIGFNQANAVANAINLCMANAKHFPNRCREVRACIIRR